MQLVNVVLLVTSILFITPHCQGNGDDDLPCTNDELYGKGNMCYFAFIAEINPEIMNNSWTSENVKFGMGCLHDYTIDFVDVSPESVGATVIPEDGKVVWGYTYLISTHNYTSTILPNIEGEGENKVLRSQQLNIEVTKDGKKQNICCNTLVTVKQPKKEKCIPPERQVKQCWIDEQVNNLSSVDLPPEYIEEFRNIPQRYCK